MQIIPYCPAHACPDPRLGEQLFVVIVAITSSTLANPESDVVDRHFASTVDVVDGKETQRRVVPCASSNAWRPATNAKATCYPLIIIPDIAPLCSGVPDAGGNSTLSCFKPRRSQGVSVEPGANGLLYVTVQVVEGPLLRARPDSDTSKLVDGMIDTLTPASCDLFSSRIEIQLQRSLVMKYVGTPVLRSNISIFHEVQLLCL